MSVYFHYKKVNHKFKHYSTLLMNLKFIFLPIKLKMINQSHHICNEPLSVIFHCSQGCIPVLILLESLVDSYALRNLTITPSHPPKSNLIMSPGGPLYSQPEFQYFMAMTTILLGRGDMCTCNNCCMLTLLLPLIDV